MRRLCFLSSWRLFSLYSPRFAHFPAEAGVATVVSVKGSTSSSMLTSSVSIGVAAEVEGQGVLAETGGDVYGPALKLTVVLETVGVTLILVVVSSLDFCFLLGGVSSNSTVLVS